MASVNEWTPFGVALNLTANPGAVTRTSATQFKVVINASWACRWSGSRTNYGMTASSGGNSITLNPFGTKSSGSSGSFTGTYSISGNGAQTKSVTVTFTNSGSSGSQSINLSFNVSVPAWTSYTVNYNANGGNGAPTSQTKWKDQNLTLSSTKPTRTGYSFRNWNTAAGGTGTAYSAGGTYSENAGVTLYAQWTANTYTISFNANGGSGAPGNQTKTYDKNLTLSSTKPTRTNYKFLGWSTSSTAGTAEYTAGGTYTANAGATLYAVWELEYWQPRITDLRADRCTSTGGLDDFQTYARVMFNWELCQLIGTNNVKSIEILYGPIDEPLSRTMVPVNASGTGGSVRQVIGAGALSSEKEYLIQVVVTDDLDGSFSVSTRIGGSSFPLDILNGGQGIAFGKPADTANLADFGFSVKFNGGVTQPVLAAGTDLNSVTKPNVYSGTENSNYKNLPTTTGSFTLFVTSAGSSGQICQKFVNCRKDDSQTWERFYYGDTWGAWHRLYGEYTIPNGTDLNNIKDPGIYIGSNAKSAGYINVPFTSGTFTLVVQPAGPSGQVKQIISLCDKTKSATWERYFYTDAWGAWDECVSASNAVAAVDGSYVKSTGGTYTGTYDFSNLRSTGWNVLRSDNTVTTNKNCAANATDGYIHFDTNTGAKGINYWHSDVKLKNSIHDSKINALRLINDIKCYEFYYNNSEHFVDNGFVAQQLEEVYEDFVFAVDNNGEELLSPNVNSLIPLLTKGMQELCMKIEELEAKLNVRDISE